MQFEDLFSRYNFFLISKKFKFLISLDLVNFKFFLLGKILEGKSLKITWMVQKNFGQHQK